MKNYKKILLVIIVMLLLYIQINKRTGAVSEYSLWITMFVLIIFHVLLSMVILGPEYYGKFYNSDKLNLVGGLSLLFGILAFLGFSIKGIFLLNTKFDKPFLLNSASTVRLKSLNFLFLGVHLFSMGISGWLMPTKWPGYLLPISLIAFLLLISSIVIFSMQNEKNK